MALRIACLLCLLAVPSHAEELASATALRSALIGNTVQGKMMASGSYAEYYAPDGSIRAADYAGKWSLSGNKMCFTYEDGGAETCWAAILRAGSVQWMSDAGVEGSGAIIAGNPSGW